MSEKQTTLFSPSPTQVGHARVDDIDVYIGRVRNDDGEIVALGDVPIGTTGWLGNPNTIKDIGRQKAIERYRKQFEARIVEDDEFRAAIEDLQGETLGCYCRTVTDTSPDCHGDVIVEWADHLSETDEW